MPVADGRGSGRPGAFDGIGMNGAVQFFQCLQILDAEDVVRIVQQKGIVPVSRPVYSARALLPCGRERISRSLRWSPEADLQYSAGSSERMEPLPAEEPCQIVAFTSETEKIHDSQTVQKGDCSQSEVVPRFRWHSRQDSSKTAAAPHFRAISARRRLGMMAGVPLWT